MIPEVKVYVTETDNEASLTREHKVQYHDISKSNHEYFNSGQTLQNSL